MGRVLQRFQGAKHVLTEIAEESFQYERNRASNATEAALDGIYVLRTSVAEEDLRAAETERAYKSLSRVERAFRCLKTTDLHGKVLELLQVPLNRRMQTETRHPRLAYPLYFARLTRDRS